MSNELWVVAVAASVLVAGGAFVVARRSRGGAAPAPVAPAPVEVTPAPIATVDTAPATVDTAPADVAQTPPSFRDRLARARGVFSAATTGVLRRSAIDQSTWDDLEDAMLRADLGVKVCGALLDPLRERVKRR
ncbi:MAG: signal recognition particle receptor subunit alpha, partial [Actinomycetota bacterium]